MGTPKIVIITGPTASGKSGLALSIAENSHAVIINADSQQMYRELRILTARPTSQEEALAPHKLYGTLSAAEHGSAGVWLKFARMEIDWALSKGQVPMIVGGTGLYLKALMEGMADMPDIAPEVRQQAASDYDAMGQESFAERLRWIDPELFTRITVLDRQRLVRAYEVWLGSGKPLSWWQAQETKPFYPQDYFTLYQMEIARDVLYARCNARFTAMIDQGAVDEVKSLLSLNLPENLPAMKSVGIQELSAYISGEMTLEQAVSAAQQATRNYAKRQMTWFRHQFSDAQAVPYDNTSLAWAAKRDEIRNLIDGNQPKY